MRQSVDCSFAACLAVAAHTFVASLWSALFFSLHNTLSEKRNLHFKSFASKDNTHILALIQSFVCNVVYIVFCIPVLTTRPDHRGRLFLSAPQQWHLFGVDFSGGYTTHASNERTGCWKSQSHWNESSRVLGTWHNWQISFLMNLDVLFGLAGQNWAHMTHSYQEWARGKKND